MCIRDKMYNAELTFKGEGGKVKDFFQQPKRSAGINRRHFSAVAPLLDSATAVGTFFTDYHTPYKARYGLVDAAALRSVLAGFQWNDKFDFAPTLAFFDQAVAQGLLTEWVVLVPSLSGADGGTAEA